MDFSLLELNLFEIPLGEIKTATDNFSEACVIGTGGYGIVYKARLDVLDIPNLSSMEGNHEYVPPKINKVVAVKRLSEGAQQHQQDVKGFLTEIKLLIRCKHHNIASLLGFSVENGEHILVYEYPLNGSLGNYLEGNGKIGNLTWAQRIKICLDIAHGVNYLHTNMEGKRRVIRRDIKSANILLDEDLKAKIADFGLSKFHSVKHQASTTHKQDITSTKFSLDPKSLTTIKYNIKVDIYSLGVVLFEVLSGSLASDAIYIGENRMGLAPIARQRFKQGRIEELIDPKLMEKDGNFNSTLNRELNQDSFLAFSEIAYQCLTERPTMEVIINKLQNAFNLQAPYKFKEILSTNNFSDEKLITKGALGEVYEGQIFRNGNWLNCTIRRLDCINGLGDEWKREISVLKSLKHKNIISILGHYDENNEKIIFYEQAFHGTLNRHLSDPTLTWSKRLDICLGVARALNHIHYDVIHCDINSSKIFLNKDWEPMIYGFEFSTEYPQSWRHRLLFSRYFGTKALTPKYDVYSFGVLLLEVLCGSKPITTNGTVEEEELDKIIDPNLKKQIDTTSLTLFKDLAYKCLNQQPVQRPTMDQIVKELEEVLELHANPEHSKAADEGTSSNFKMDVLEIPLSEIKRATNDFNETYTLGSGGFGKVYKAKLDVLDIQSLSSMEAKCKEELPKIRASVAIKRITRTDELSKQGFLTEVKLLSRCKHPNIVSLLGFSGENDELILVYEYASKGSLGDYLLGNGKIANNLTWVQRLQICLDTANGINYLHTNMEGKPRIIHRDIKSDNILLDKNLNAKVGDFGLSKIHPAKQRTSTIYANSVVGTETYVDPEYWNTFKYKKETDIYSFGVVLFEVLSGRFAWDSIYTIENRMGLAAIARRRFNEETLKELIDPKLTEEDEEHTFTLNKGPNKKSFRTFSKIAYQCLAETQAKRPTMDAIIKKLQKALKLQGDSAVLTRFLPDDIVSATKNFAEAHCIGLDKNGKVYKAELDHYGSSATKGKSNLEPSKKRITVAIKHITNRKGEHKKNGFFEELEMHAYKHPNIVSLIGLCDEGDKMILVYEHASSRSLSDCLKKVNNMDSFTWGHRLRICLEIARGLNHLQAKMDDQNIIRTDIRSGNIMLDKNGEAKVGYFVISNLHLANEEICMKVYKDPEYGITHKLETKSDMYSFGVVLFEIFCGTVAYDPVYIAENNKGLVHIARQCFKDGTVKRIMDSKLKEDISTGPNQDSLDIFLKVAFQCSGEALKRPTFEMVINELERALHFHDPPS